MHRAPWPLALAVLISCGSGDGGDDDAPTASPFGLDTRPSNTACVAKQPPPLDTNVRLQRMWNGVTFNQPLYMTQAPGDDSTWYVAEKSGPAGTANQARIRAVPVTATSNAQVRDFATITVNPSGEGGLLGLAFHPEWPSRREVYVSHTRNVDPGNDPAPVCTSPRTAMMTSVLVRYTSSNGMTLDGPPDEILRVGQPFTNHKGGNIQFGRDGMLYFGLGDGGDRDDTCGAGQNLTTLLGKMLRIDIEAPAGMYKIPADNPFVSSATARKEIWAYGLRNPWRWSFDKASDELWLGDVGQGTFEEIDRIVKGGNYGWNTCEGFHRRGNTTTLCNIGGLIDPIAEHPRSEAASITGGYVYHGTAMPSLAGTYIYGDFVTGNVWALTFNASNKATPKLILTGVSGLSSFAQGSDGELYTIQLSNGVISKLVPGGPPPADDFPKVLSATGCVDAADATKPAAAMIPYEVNSPLWSDGAEKQRYLGIPDGATIKINADGDWDLPVGSVAMKTFSVGGKLVETRLFMRHDDGGWAGYTYEWNDDGKDATLLSGSKLKALGDTAAWAYPSRSQCIQCHSAAAGSTLGFDTAQLNRDTVYASTNRKANQLATLDHIGMFSAPLAQAPEAAPKLSDPAGSDPIEARARSYLHANCSHCHRPMGGAQGTIDLRYTQSLRDTATCNAGNTAGPVNGAAKIILPGSPQQSILSARLHATDSKRMPPVAVSVTDEAGAKVIDDWITSLTNVQRARDRAPIAAAARLALLLPAAALLRRIATALRRVATTLRRIASTLRRVATALRRIASTRRVATARRITAARGLAALAEHGLGLLVRSR
jgi:uncharacterized repeat protein (TIGR03806 family)